MDHHLPTPTTRLVSRRHALITGTVGTAAAAFLAACSSDSQAGRSGTPTTTTAVAPTIPRKAPTAEALDENVTLLRTGASLELLVAKAYDRYGPKLDDPTWSSAAERFSADHASTAVAFNAALEPDQEIEKVNAFIAENTIDPIEETLNSDRAILDLFRDLESTLAATYVDAAGTFTEADWRARVMTFGSASARRATVLDNDGKGAAPTEATYPLRDLIPSAAYLPVDAKKADAP